MSQRRGAAPVAVILVNYMGAEHTLACIDSLRCTEGSNWFVVVVDNASPDDSLKTLASLDSDPRVQLIRSPENLGFAAGNNLGMRAAMSRGAEYFWILNNDTLVEPDTLRALLDVAVSRNGMFASAILRYPETDRVWCAGGWIDPRSPRAGHVHEDEPATNLPEEPFEVDYAPGCSVLLSRQTLDQIGFMPEDFFLYYEDTAWCELAKGEGVQILCVPASRVYHKVSQSTGEFSPRMKYFLSRASVLFARRFRNIPHSCWFVLRYHLINHLFKFEWGHFVAGLRGVRDGILGRLA